MAAQRKYSDEQRMAILRLADQDFNAGEISKRCEAGRAGVQAFRIPRRTVTEILLAARADSDPAPPISLTDAEGVDLTERNAKRIQAILSNQLNRLEKRSRFLTHDELARLEKVRVMNDRMRKAARPTRKAHTPGPKPKRLLSALDGLAVSNGADSSQSSERAVPTSAPMSAPSDPQLTGTSKPS